MSSEVHVNHHRFPRLFCYNPNLVIIFACFIYFSYIAGDDASIAAGPAQAVSAGPVRQSSAINFNAALGGWGPPARLASARPVHKASAAALANVKIPQSHVLQSMKAVSLQAQPQQTSSTGQVVSGSEQHAQDLRPRSSDGILQRITVDRGPAKGQFIPIRLWSIPHI